MTADPFEAAREQLERLVERDVADPAIDPRCVPRVLQCGRRTPSAVVLLHGLTNCPQQFAELAERFAGIGWNAYVPRMPHHGMRDKLTSALGALTCDELERAGDQAVRLARGLGERVAVIGISSGGTLAAWLAVANDVDVAVAVAPLFGLRLWPQPLEKPLRLLLQRLPNAALWWDPRLRESMPPAHAYPRFSTHALAQCLLLGERAAAAAPRGARARRSILIVNSREPAVSNAAAQAVWKTLAARGAGARTVVLDDLDTRHDIIEPSTYPAARDLVYPKLIEAVASS